MPPVNSPGPFLGALGYEAFHLFDVYRREWVVSEKKLGIKERIKRKRYE